MLTKHIVVIILQYDTYQFIMLSTLSNTMLYVNCISIKLEKKLYFNMLYNNLFAKTKIM